jgi:hypothetical protein
MAAVVIGQPVAQQCGGFGDAGDGFFRRLAARVLGGQSNHGAAIGLGGKQFVVLAKQPAI